MVSSRVLSTVDFHLCFVYTQLNIRMRASRLLNILFLLPAIYIFGRNAFVSSPTFTTVNLKAKAVSCVVVTEFRDRFANFL